MNIVRVICIILLLTGTSFAIENLDPLKKTVSLGVSGTRKESDDSVLYKTKEIKYLRFFPLIS